MPVDEKIMGRSLRAIKMQDKNRFVLGGGEKSLSYLVTSGLSYDYYGGGIVNRTYDTH